MTIAQGFGETADGIGVGKRHAGAEAEQVGVAPADKRGVHLQHGGAVGPGQFEADGDEVGVG